MSVDRSISMASRSKKKPCQFLNNNNNNNNNNYNYYFKLHHFTNHAFKHEALKYILRPTRI